MTTKNGNAAPVKRVENKRPGLFFDLLRRLVLEKPMGTFGLGLIIVFFTMGIFSKFIMPFSWSQIHLLERLQGPSGKYFLGTDELGRDELSRLIYGARISMEIGIGATLLNTVVSILIGATSGFLGGKTDMIVQRFVDVWMSIPGFVILLTVMTILPRSLLTMIMVLGITGGIGGARLVRSAVIAIKSNTVCLGLRSHRLLAGAHFTGAYYPEHHADADHYVHFGYRRQHSGRSRPELPWFRSAARSTFLGRVD